MAEELPLGGNLNDAVRVGNTVRRRAGPWTPAVHALLRFLEAEGFPAPRARGMDEKGREVLDYIEGEAYGLEDRAALIPALRARLVHVGRFIDEQAKLGDPGMERLVAWDTPRQMFVKDLGYIDENRRELERALA